MRNGMKTMMTTVGVLAIGATTAVLDAGTASASATSTATTYNVQLCNNLTGAPYSVGLGGTSVAVAPDSCTTLQASDGQGFDIVALNSAAGNPSHHFVFDSQNANTTYASFEINGSFDGPEVDANSATQHGSTESYTLWTK